MSNLLNLIFVFDLHYLGSFHSHLLTFLFSLGCHQQGIIRGSRHYEQIFATLKHTTRKYVIFEVLYHQFYNLILTEIILYKRGAHIYTFIFIARYFSAKLYYSVVIHMQNRRVEI